MEKLKVYYGWSRKNKVRKRISLSIMFENDLSCREERGQKTLTLIQTTCCERYQDEEESLEAKKQNRIFTGYDLFLDDKHINGNLERLLEVNSEADKRHVSSKERERIKKILRESFMRLFPDYIQTNQQLELFKEEI